MNRVLPIAATLVLLSACEPADRVPDRLGADVDALFEHFNERPGPGVAVAVIREGEIVFASGYGLADLEQNVPITPQTVFDMASVSKQFTGLAVSMLVEEGRLSLEDDVRTYIPELHDFGPTITIDHLVHHTSGVRDWPGTLAVGGWRMDDVISFDQILDFAFHQRSLNFVPGAEFTYSNTGYNLLAETIARVTGMTFPEWTAENIFRPLGMENTHFQDDHTEVVAHRAFGYEERDDGGFARTTDNLTALGSSSLFSTVEDLAAWVANFETAKVGGQSAMDRTRTRGVLNDGSEIPYAFGVRRGEYRGLPTVRHGGSWASFRTEVIHFPEQRLGVVILANHPFDTGRAALDVADLYLAEELAASGASDGEAAPDAPVVVPASLLDAYEGTYRLGPGWYITIRRDGGGLMTRATGEDEYPMTARTEREFWVDGYEAAMVFAPPTSGASPSLEYKGNRAPRVSDEAGTAVPNLSGLEGRYESEELRTFYDVSVVDGQIVMSHPRHGQIILTQAFEDDFTGSAWFMSSVQFTRSGGAVDGLLVNQMPRSRNIRFVKRR